MILRVLLRVLQRQSKSFPETEVRAHSLHFFCPPPKQCLYVVDGILAIEACPLFLY